MNNKFWKLNNQHEKNYYNRYQEYLGLKGPTPVLTKAMGIFPTNANLDEIDDEPLKCFEKHGQDIVLLHVTETMCEVDFLFFERFHPENDTFDQAEVDYDNRRYLSWYDEADPSLRKVQALRYYVDNHDYDIDSIIVHNYGINKLCLVDPWLGYDLF